MKDFSKIEIQEKPKRNPVLSARVEQTDHGDGNLLKSKSNVS